MLLWCAIASVAVLAVVAVASGVILRRGVQSGQVRRVDMTDIARGGNGSTSGSPHSSVRQSS